MKRREFLGLSVGGAIAALSSRAQAQASLKEIRIGYQKTGVLVIARQQAVLEKRFAAKQIGIKWIEFTSGPPLLEAMSTGSVDLGAVGDTPPIFAQAANANIVYVAGSPITNGQGILVPANSGIRTIADLKGKRVGFTKGTSAHNVVIATLEKEGLTYEDITPVYLTPPDAGPAFANGSIEAWAVWDPYFAIGEKRQNGRILVNAHEVAKTNSFYLANRDFANTHVRETREVIDDLTEAALGRGQSCRGRQRARGRHRRAARGPDRRRQPRLIPDRPRNRRDCHDAAVRRRPLPQAWPDPEADRRARHRLAPYPKLNSTRGT
jgi:sulfonate transport system substrate-binding protein